jgi:hypothetical protein
MTPEQREALAGFIRHLVQAASAVALYSLDHRQVAWQISQASERLKEAMPADGVLALTLVADEIFADGKPMAKSPLLERFVKGFSACAIEQVTIRSGATCGDLEILARIVAFDPPGQIRSSEHLNFGSLVLLANSGALAEADPMIPSYSAIPEQLFEGLAATYQGLGSGKALDLTSIISVVKGFIIAFRREANPFLALVPVREMDEYTFTHSINVCILNLAQGMTLGFEGQLLHDIGVSALLHDVGKVFVPAQILNKPGSLEEWEWEAVRRHTVRGAEYLLNTPGIPRLAVLSAFEHHLKYDVTGYPKVPAGWRINLCSQMTMVSDYFDALRTRRVYRDAMDFEKAAGQMLAVAGTQLNPSLTLNFLRTLRKMGER